MTGDSSPGPRWYLFGAQAVLTEDVDVTVKADAVQLPGLVAALGRAGFIPLALQCLFRTRSASMTNPSSANSG